MTRRQTLETGFLSHEIAGEAACRLDGDRAHAMGRTSNAADPPAPHRAGTQAISGKIIKWAATAWPSSVDAAVGYSSRVRRGRLV